MAYEPTLIPHVREQQAYSLDFNTKRAKGYEALRKARRSSRPTSSIR
jgi:hypothetical protein